MPDRWCTVTVSDPTGMRHSVDVQASSTFDAAHLFVTQATGNHDTKIARAIARIRDAWGDER